MPRHTRHRLRPSWCHLLAAPAAAWHALVSAQSPSPAPPAQRVEIRAAPGSERRADVAGRQVIGRADLLRHGDTQLADALQRVPGITVERRGQGIELKLSGLGDGRTLVLLNGEPLPRGVPLDSIALDTLERVEIVNGASVETAQAIAGTINLVTRRPTTLATRDVRLSLASEWGLPQASATLNLGDAVGAATWGLGLTLSSDRRRWPAT
ncbi:MAG: TonB-dependent receptor plug domain-containing protein, partial [Rhodoferax sp.]|nr:TonB-dependent receptor plug domain-containing protein [Rhodoferax sp.]